MAFRLSALPPSCDWSVSEVCDWLEILGLEKYREAFVTEEISGATLFKLTSEELRSEFGMPLGDCKLLMAELDAQRQYNEDKRLSRTPTIQRKGQLGVGEPLDDRLRQRVRLFAGDGTRRAEPLTEEELECWDYQVSWLRCAITGRAWPTDDKALIGMALYHQPRFVSPQEMRRRQLDEEHAVRRKRRVVAISAEAVSPKDAGEEEEQQAASTSAGTADEEDMDGWDVVVDGRSGGGSGILDTPEQDQLRVGRNNKGEVGVGDEYDRDFGVYPDVEPPPKANFAPIPAGATDHLGWIEVMVGPVFERDAYNRGAVGLEGRTLGYEKRGLVCMDRQYNAVNFQFYVQRHANSFARKICTSRLSFYIEEGHGSRVFPDNILCQLSLLFYRTNNKLKTQDGRVHQEKVASCIMRAIPKVLLQTVLEVVQGAGFDQYCEHAVRLYLLVHHTAIKLISYFPKAHQCVYDAVKAWIQNPFSPEAIFGPEEAMLAASLVSVPFSLLREALVRRVLHDMQGAPSATTAVLLKQNQELLERLTFVQSFFEGGPGRLGVKELEKKYTRCAGTLPKPEREQLLSAVREATVDSCEDWWRMTGMDGVFTDDERCAANMQGLREHVLANAATWRQKQAERPRAAHTSGHIGAEELGGAPQRGSQFLSAAAKRQQYSEQRRRELEAARALHEGYPTLVDGKLDSHRCLYCQEIFRSTGALFRHLNKMIPAERMISGWHQEHFAVRTSPEVFSGSAPFRCPARCCVAKIFASAEELREHLCLMGTPLSEEASAESMPAEAAEVVEAAAAEEEAAGAEAADTEAVEVVEEVAADPHASLGRCFRCTAACDTLLAQCGHIVACSKCAESLEACPVCSKPVALRIKVCWS